MRVMALSVLCFLAGGCGNLTLSKPSASFRSMSIEDVSGRGFTMNVDVDVRNPNSVALPLGAVDYSLGLGGVEVIEKSRLKSSTTVPANGRETIRIPIPLTFRNLLEAEEAIRRGGGDVSYKLDAGLSFDTGTPLIGELRVSFRHEGTIPVQKLLRQNWSAILTSSEARSLAERVLGGLPF